ncbi:glycerophosphoryl diester phosphodiesterase family protein [Latilactobacillus graminis DSM 20719]|uniref:Glycerophosphoryl diester phosphodiesterase family protein n=1 Tax=Latilactobacillus graminis DSM 20719 TaxID=1423752 RepID=A0AA89L4U0_9LACO|nr:glycerophosphoryl diester phosphodiesterase family protein [Latilactobacillus graminis DSM 20719]
MTGFTVVAHRGDPINAPEETFQSIDMAFSEGANYVELDLHESQDGVLVISHDRNLKRVTGIDAIVSQYPFTKLSQLRLSNDEPLHSVNQLFEHYQNNPHAKFLIETKKTKKGNPQDMEAKLVALIQQYHMQDRVMVHSFSLASLQNMQRLMPQIPRIFIVGSLKRISFESFKYADGINISSALVTPTIIKQLHYLHQKVFVWNEMSENQATWNWLINLNVDGVVTNYPALGRHYQTAQDQAVHEDLAAIGQVNNTQNLPTVENPYAPNLHKSPAKAGHTYHITQAVTLDDQTYYQIGTNRFVVSDSINLGETAQAATLLVGKTAQIKPTAAIVSTWNSPLHPTQITGYLSADTQYPIHGVRYVGNQVWLQVAQGWFKSRQALIDFNPNQSLLLAYCYRQLPQQLRPTNLRISPLLPLKSSNLHPINEPAFTQFARSWQPITIKF